MPQEREMPRENLRELYIKRGLSSNQIAKKLHTSKSVILRKLKLNKIPVRSQVEGWKLRFNTDKDFRERLRKVARENISKAKPPRGRTPWNKGIPRSKETKRKISVKTKGRTPWNKGLTKEVSKALQEISKKLSLSRRKENNPYWGKGKRPKKEILIKLYVNEGKTRKDIARIFGVTKNAVDKWLKFYNVHLSSEEKKRHRKPWTEERRRNFSKFIKEIIKRKKHIFLKNLFCTKKPTSIERYFMELCKKYGFPFRYVGNGAFWLGNKNPDFINNDLKLIIEVLGDYWHTEEEVKEREKYFNKFGYKTLMIWQRELNCEEKVVEKVRRWLDDLTPTVLFVRPDWDDLAMR